MNLDTLISSYMIKKLDFSNVDEVYELCKENTIYYQCCPPFVSKESIKNDMRLTPKNVSLQDKYYVGVYDQSKLICVMDLIDHYPDKTTVYIGFFMMNKRLQNRGIGSKIFQELCVDLSNMGYERVCLSWVKNNQQSENFWLKNGMQVIKETNSDSVGQVVKFAQKLMKKSQKM